MKYITPESMVQYQKEERALIATRLKSSRQGILDILRSMEHDTISLPENIASLKIDLAKHYGNDKFLECKNMGQIMKTSLEELIKK
jgi:hypothetical protein